MGSGGKIRCGEQRDVGRAHAIAVGNGGKSLDVAAEQAGECLGLGFAQLWELLGHVGNRAMVLANLRAVRRAPGRCCESVGGESVGKCLGTVLRSCCFDQRADAFFELVDSVTGEGMDSFLSPVCLEVAQRGEGQVVISLVEVVAAGIGDDEDLGRSAASAGTVDALFTRFDDAVSEQEIKVSTHGCGRQVKPLGKVDRRGRALFQDGIGNTFTGRRIVDMRRLLDPNVFHNISMSLFTGGFNEGMPNLSRPDPSRTRIMPIE